MGEQNQKRTTSLRHGVPVTIRANVLGHQNVTGKLANRDHWSDEAYWFVDLDCSLLSEPNEDGIQCIVKAVRVPEQRVEPIDTFQKGDTVTIGDYADVPKAIRGRPASIEEYNPRTKRVVVYVYGGENTLCHKGKNVVIQYTRVELPEHYVTHEEVTHMEEV